MEKQEVRQIQVNEEKSLQNFDRKHSKLRQRLLDSTWRYIVMYELVLEQCLNPSLNLFLFPYITLRSDRML